MKQTRLPYKNMLTGERPSQLKRRFRQIRFEFQYLRVYAQREPFPNEQKVAVVHLCRAFESLNHRLQNCVDGDVDLVVQITSDLFDLYLAAVSLVQSPENPSHRLLQRPQEDREPSDERKGSARESTKSTFLRWIRAQQGTFAGREPKKDDSTLFQRKILGIQAQIYNDAAFSLLRQLVNYPRGPKGSSTSQ